MIQQAVNYFLFNIFVFYNNNCGVNDKMEVTYWSMSFLSCAWHLLIESESVIREITSNDTVLEDTNMRFEVTKRLKFLSKQWGSS